jgi:SAM-dependent methyltransferase
MEEERGTFDVVLFTRSLHHIGQDLTGVLRLVRDRLLRREDGLLIIEEFGREDCDQLTAEWYYALHDSLLAAGLISPPRRHRHHHQHKGQDQQHDTDQRDDAKQEEELMKKEEKRDALERWERQFKWSHHGMEGIEHLHLGHEMVAAIESVFGRIDVQRQPVLFRFIANHVDRRLNASPTNHHHNNESAQAEEKAEAGSKAYEISRTVLRWEQKMIDRGRVLPLGILGVATVDQRMGRQDSTNSRPSSVSQC